ncbi:MAG: LysM peptidoglycan-binding domain-containing protein [Clostridia bacterium]|nr:LysM peptidoglycan-binding domain-containing protein [Clostridia bacterium]
MARRAAAFLLVALTVVAATWPRRPAIAAERVLLAYRVDAGDTFWLLAERLGASPDEIARLNPQVSPDRLEIGQQLFVPVVIEDGAVRYRVLPGDTLFLVGRRFGRSAEAVRAASSLSGDELQPGQVLRVPLAAAGQVLHGVQEGESLFLVARRYGTDVGTLRRLNRLATDELRVGQVLVVPAAATGQPAAPGAAPGQGGTPAAPTGDTPSTEPVVYRVVPGDTLFAIALRFQTTPSVISQSNRLHSDVLMPGQPLFVVPGALRPFAVQPPKGEQRAGYGELLEWAWVRWYFNVGAVATVTDLATGIRFRVRHMGGVNHADVEPLTAVDTAALLRAAGGSWTWQPRPALVAVDGRVFAASYSPMPHDVETITDNDFPGHFDLYFWKSSGHTSDLLTPVHNDNVLAAAGLRPAS